MSVIVKLENIQHESETFRWVGLSYAIPEVIFLGL